MKQRKRRQKILAATCALLMAGALALAGCGSSGGDSNPSSTNPPATSTGTTGSVTYSGTTTQAALDTTSGATVSTAATTNISSVSAIASGVGLSPSLLKAAPGIQPIAEAASMMEAASFMAPTTTAGTCPSNPGSYTVDVTAASSGAYDYSMTYNQYCTGTATDNYNINGSYTISGTKGNYTVTADKLTISFVYGTSTYSAEYGGKITAVTSGNVTTTTINYAYNVSGTAMTAYSFKLENFVIEDTTTSTAVTTKYTGRFYYSTTGYVDITTPTLLSRQSSGGKYTSGTIRFTGSGGNYYEITYQSDGTTTSNLNGTSSSTAPTVTSFTPSSGAVGATVTISGTNFSTTAANNTVKFNGTQATVSAATATSITVTVPTGATTGAITVTVGGQTATSATSFTVTAAAVTVPPGTLLGGAIQGTPLNLTGTVTTLAGSVGVGSANGTGTAASFNNPMGVTTDGTNLYVAESQNRIIRKIVIATGAVTTFAGSGSAGAADGTGTSASFNSPQGITTDGSNLYVTDYGSSNIRKIVIATGAVTTLAGLGTAGFADGTGTAAAFSRPDGITTDGSNLYVADSLNRRIRKIVIATGAVTTFAGSGAYGAADGTGTAASFGIPRGITTDGTNLYVTDEPKSNIRKIVIATGVVSTLAGSGAYGSADGTGTAATFNGLRAITTDGSNLYVADGGYPSGYIRKIVIATGVVSTPTAWWGQGITTDGSNLYVTNNTLIGKIQ